MVLLGGAWTLSGCASPLLDAKVRGLEKRVAELSAKNDESLHRQDDLENRVFLLSDQVESQKVAQVRRGAPDLPVVALDRVAAMAVRVYPPTTPVREIGRAHV